MPRKKVTKCDIIEAIYQNTRHERLVVQQVVENFIAELKGSLISGSTIELRGFGTFEPRLRKGRRAARNPRTGELSSVRPHYVAMFRSGRDLKQALWNLNVEAAEP